MPKPFLKKIDCFLLPVPDLDSALEFYRDKLGHKLVWRSKTAAGLKLAESDTELVLHTEFKESETDILVDSADEAAKRFVEAGGTIVKEPIDIQIGRCAIVRDPFGNELVLLDMSKGKLKTDEKENVIE